ncbi:recombinase family protein [Agrilutibacter solisilvae]|uniref:Recombinase family protein n=1 Tax=Agrilutibacter solisilvae TaxID=2763317 RepID=A0A975ASJ2_9GAMM|nr:recombinase family protein [Lysobacter solisilvae]QSX78114.1 recombinase family protein [Lysobacter solisilvae]
MATSPKLVAYYRVSTARQGRSGLGLAAQEAAVKEYANNASGAVLASFTEIESGKRDDRPELTKALQLADVTGATLVIAKLDRLSRDAAFLLQLQKSGIRFAAADIPNADNTTIGVLAVIAQTEREAISRRTKEALAAAKARGVKLGNPNGAEALRRAGRGNQAGTAAAARKAKEHAAKVKPIVDALGESGFKTFGAIAGALNARGVLTLHGKSWHSSSVRNLLARS